MYMSKLAVMVPPSLMCAFGGIIKMWQWIKVNVVLVLSEQDLSI